MDRMKMMAPCEICGLTNHPVTPTEYQHYGFRLALFVCEGCMAVIRFDAQRKLIEVVKDLREEHAEIIAKMNAERMKQDGNQDDDHVEAGERGDRKADAADDSGEVPGGRAESSDDVRPARMARTPVAKRDKGSVSSFPRVKR